jgi:hypothetical protein
MRTLRIAVAWLAAALALSGVAAASASAKPLVLRTAKQGALTSADMTWTSTTASFTFGEELCPPNPLEKLKWKVNVTQEGSKYSGQALDQSALQCTLKGGTVTVAPDPHPWSAKLAGNGKATIKSVGKIGLLATLPGGAHCTYGSSKMILTFPVAGPLHPVPLEPGDPGTTFRLVKTGASPSCPLLAKEAVTFNASVTGPNGEEPVLDE